MDALGYVDCGDNREEILFPWVREVIAARKPAEVLDFGCGDARFSLGLARHAGCAVTAYDRDPAMREQARRRVAAEDGGAVTLSSSPDAAWCRRFDAIALLGVWMCWRTETECRDALGLLARSLKPDGVLVASVTHPCFRDRGFATYRTDFDVHDYMADARPFQVLVGTSGREVAIEDYHWNLEAMLRQAKAAGLFLVEMKEHADGPGRTLPSWLSLVFGPR